MFLLTAFIAVGMVVANIRDGGLTDFCLGVLTALVVTGLVQQIVLPPLSAAEGSLARRVCLGFILICLAIAIYRSQHPYIVPDPNLHGVPQEYELGSEVAYPLWLFSLMLGSLTAPWMAASGRVTGGQHWSLRFGMAAGFLVFFLLYVGFVVIEWTFIPMLVDVAIDGVRVGMQQGPAVDTPHFVQWFGRTPQQLRNFVDSQIFSWPLLLLALIVAVWRSQSADRSVVRGIVAATIIVGLSTPAAINAFWLIDGAAIRLSPEFVTTYWEEPRPDLAMIVWPLLLLAMYLTTRRATVCESQSVRGPKHVYSSDHRIVGWMFVAIGSAALVEHFENVKSWDELTVSAMELFYAFAYPEYSYTLFLLPFGFCWLWRRRKVQEPSTARWPQVQLRQLLLFPCVLGLLIAVIALCIPFGIAMFHFAL